MVVPGIVDTETHHDVHTPHGKDFLKGIDRNDRRRGKVLRVDSGDDHPVP